MKQRPRIDVRLRAMAVSLMILSAVPFASWASHAAQSITTRHTISHIAK